MMCISFEELSEIQNFSVETKRLIFKFIFKSSVKRPFT